MSIDRFEIFTCDRCGLETRSPKGDSGSWQPPSWSTVVFFSPPKAGMDHDSALDRTTLCSTCTLQVKRAVAETPPQALKPDRTVAS
jgi:hypothetical protein